MILWFVFVVLDSNVVVAGLRSRRGASFEVLRLLRAGRFRIAISVPLVLEYESVLVRHAAELGLTRDEAVGLVDFLCDVGTRTAVHFLWRPTLSDPGDEFILELAVTAGCEGIVTHNVGDFAGARPFQVWIATPRDFLRRIEGPS
jgi:predicted nucleic acid-binding protein